MSGKTIKFDKLHGLGNDFIIIRSDDLPPGSPSQLAVSWCRRGTGIGADGLVVLSEETSKGFRMKIFNRDGSNPEICGNGIRCSVRSWSARTSLRDGMVTVETDAGPKACRLHDNGDVEVEMGPAVVDEHRPTIEGIEGITEGVAVNVGNPHLVIWGSSWPDIDSKWAAKLERHPHFPNRTNVSFARIEGERRVVLTVWERGVGFTQACGSAACATAAAAVCMGEMLPNRWLAVALPGGVLDIRVSDDLSRLTMKGPASWVYQGEMRVEG